MNRSSLVIFRLLTHNDISLWRNTKDKVMETMVITRTSNLSESTQIARIGDKVLPALSGSSLTYDPVHDFYHTMGYTSAAGNTYFKAIRLSDRLIVYYDLRIGYAYTFLNGITLFGYNGRDIRLLSKKSFNCFFFNEYDAKRQSEIMLKEYIDGQAKMAGEYLPEAQILSFAQRLISETHCKQLN